MLYICVHGTGVPVIAAETEGRAGKGEDGTARTREVKLCCVFTQTSLDEKGRQVRDPHPPALARPPLSAVLGTVIAR
ncbi:MAG: hypothetical protein ACRDOK_25080 [Streptosporangiaceae bacterium]